MAASWLPADHRFNLIYCANMLHISPWATCAALMRGSAQHLAPGRQLITYGPYLEDAVPTSPGNLAFDQSLRARNPAWGIRRREDVEAHMTALVNHLTSLAANPGNAQIGQAYKEHLESLRQALIQSNLNAVFDNSAS